MFVDSEAEVARKLRGVTAANSSVTVDVAHESPCVRRARGTFGICRRTAAPVARFVVIALGIDDDQSEAESVGFGIPILFVAELLYHSAAVVSKRERLAVTVQAIRVVDRVAVLLRKGDARSPSLLERGDVSRNDDPLTGADHRTGVERVVDSVDRITTQVERRIGVDIHQFDEFKIVVETEFEKRFVFARIGRMVVYFRDPQGNFDRELHGRRCAPKVAHAGARRDPLAFVDWDGAGK